jgi:hypothetical protein
VYPPTILYRVFQLLFIRQDVTCCISTLISQFINIKRKKGKKKQKKRKERTKEKKGRKKNK